MGYGKILILGASGYIGSRLTEKLLAEGYQVRACARSATSLKAHAWAEHPRVELRSADVFNAQDLTNVCHDCQAVFYLVHSMNKEQKDFVNADRLAAGNMVQAAQQAGVQRIIYLGGLGQESAALSKHLRSRAEVSKILQAGFPATTTLQAAMIIGKGSASFEILRYLVERLPVMITPRWVGTLSQPIAVDNVLNYLSGALKNELTTGGVYDIGGVDIVSYRELMDIYAQEAGLRKRLIIPVPVLTPRLSSYWIHLVTPYPSYIARPLAEGLKNKVVCRENRIRAILPQSLQSCRDAIRAAVSDIKEERMVVRA